MRAVSFVPPIAEPIMTTPFSVARRGQYIHHRGPIVIHSGGTKYHDHPSTRRGERIVSHVLGLATLDAIVPADTITTVSDLGVGWRDNFGDTLIDQTVWDALAPWDKRYVWLFSDPQPCVIPIPWKSPTGSIWQFAADQMCPTCDRFVKQPADRDADPLDPHTWDHLTDDHREAVLRARTMI